MVESRYRRADCKPVSTVQDRVSTFLSVKPLDIFIPLDYFQPSLTQEQLVFKALLSGVCSLNPTRLLAQWYYKKNMEI